MSVCKWQMCAILRVFYLPLGKPETVDKNRQGLQREERRWRPGSHTCVGSEPGRVARATQLKMGPLWDRGVFPVSTSTVFYLWLQCSGPWTWGPIKLGKPLQSARAPTSLLGPKSAFTLRGAFTYHLNWKWCACETFLLDFLFEFHPFFCS